MPGLAVRIADDDGRTLFLQLGKGEASAIDRDGRILHHYAGQERREVSAGEAVEATALRGIQLPRNRDMLAGEHHFARIVGRGAVRAAGHRKQRDKWDGQRAASPSHGKSSAPKS